MFQKILSEIKISEPCMYIPIQNFLKKNNFFFFFADQSPVSKVILGSLAISHVGLNLGMFSHLQKYLVCKIPGNVSMHAYS